MKSSSDVIGTERVFKQACTNFNQMPQSSINLFEVIASPFTDLEDFCKRLLLSRSISQKRNVTLATVDLMESLDYGEDTENRYPAGRLDLGKVTESIISQCKLSALPDDDSSSTCRSNTDSAPSAKKTKNERTSAKKIADEVVQEGTDEIAKNAEHIICLVIKHAELVKTLRLRNSRDLLEELIRNIQDSTPAKCLWYIVCSTTCPVTKSSVQHVFDITPNVCAEYFFRRGYVDEDGYEKLLSHSTELPNNRTAIDVLERNVLRYSYKSSDNVRSILNWHVTVPRFISHSESSAYRDFLMHGGGKYKTPGVLAYMVLSDEYVDMQFIRALIPKKEDSGKHAPSDYLELMQELGILEERGNKCLLPSMLKHALRYEVEQSDSSKSEFMDASLEALNRLVTGISESKTQNDGISDRMLFEERNNLPRVMQYVMTYFEAVEIKEDDEGRPIIKSFNIEPYRQMRVILERIYLENRSSQFVEVVHNMVDSLEFTIRKIAQYKKDLSEEEGSQKNEITPESLLPTYVAYIRIYVLLSMRNTHENISGLKRISHKMMKFLDDEELSFSEKNKAALWKDICLIDVEVCHYLAKDLGSFIDFEQYAESLSSEMIPRSFSDDTSDTLEKFADLTANMSEVTIKALSDAYDCIWAGCNISQYYAFTMWCVEHLFSPAAIDVYGELITSLLSYYDVDYPQDPKFSDVLTIMRLKWSAAGKDIAGLQRFSSGETVSHDIRDLMNVGYLSELREVETVSELIRLGESGSVRKRVETLRENSQFKEIKGMCSVCLGDLDYSLKDYKSAADNYKRAYTILFNEGRQSDATLCRGKLLLAYSDCEDYVNAESVRKDIIMTMHELSKTQPLTYHRLCATVPRSYI